ncbi:pyrroline-5-carboxylate reductase [Trueperella pecoris]|uniref:pyrroline-5-carboxylate reductase n=1 Tax=Trueperella pecoris TaxID=2733571 RepID=UPI00186B6935|nr:pyrroline-5-carboxylate reductase [Trueperella pecoris]QOQ39117.1 pyrroline-5-carboxylate reductase [Trueperella pecoris]
MLGFIGTGNMGGAILAGVLSAGLVAPDDVVFTRANAQAGASQAKHTGSRFIGTNRAVYESLGEGEMLIVGVKPHVIGKVLRELGEETGGQVIVSVAAGVSLHTLAEHAPAGSPIVRVMPNVNSQIGAGMSALCPNAAVTDSQLAAVRRIFDSIGQTVVITEKDFPAFSAIAGCSPAWTYTYIDALARAALAAGITLDSARRIAAQAVLGSAQLVLAKHGEFTPSELRDQVTSPGGTTIAGLIAMESAGFTPAVIDAVNAAIARDAEIGKA